MRAGKFKWKGWMVVIENHCRILIANMAVKIKKFKLKNIKLRTEHQIYTLFNIGSVDNIG
jgi:hypothetical protein